MAKFRHITVETASDWGAAGTKRFNLDYIKPITQIFIRGTFTAGTTTWAAAVAANITKIEIVDGTTVLWSGTGKAAQALQMYQTGKGYPGYTHLRSAKAVGLEIVINFGRFFGDRKYAFDPTAFKNPQLVITWDEDVSCTTQTTNSIGIRAILFDEEAPKPASFLGLYEVLAYNPGASTRKDIDIPTDMIVRQLYFMAQESQQSLAASMGNVKLTEDGDERVPYNDTASNISRNVNETMPLLHQDFRIHVATSGDTYFSYIGNIIGGTTGSYDAALASGFASHMGGSFKINAETGSNYYTAHITGYNPHGMFNLPLCDYEDDATWFNANKLGTWQLQLTAGAQADSALTYYVYTERVVPNKQVVT